MALCDQCFEDFLHPLIHEAIEKNEGNARRYGKHERWDWDSDSSTLTFSDPVNSTLRVDVTVVGTTEGGSWQWSWANRNFEAYEKLDMEKVRDFGEANGFEQLTSAFLEADEYTGWNMTAVAANVLDAPGTYRFPTDDGHCYLIFRKIAVLPKELKNSGSPKKRVSTST